MKLKDNTPYSFTDNADKFLRLANRSISSLAQDNKNRLLVFPMSFQDCEDKLGEQCLFQMRTETNGFSLKTGNVAGFIGIDDLQISIHSRFADLDSDEDYFLHYMLQKVLSVNVFELKHSTTNEQVFDFLLYLFPYYLNGALSQGLYKEYQRNEYNDSHVRGTIDLNRHIRKNVPFCGKIAYQTREFCYDNHITQLIRHTVEYIRTRNIGEYLLHQNSDIQQGVSMIVSATPKYRHQDRQKVIQSNMKPLHHPYFTRYTALQTLCLQILRHKQLKYGKCDNEVYGILFDVSWLWEEYLATILTKRGFKHPNNRWRKDGIYMGYNINNKQQKAFLRYPDFYDKKKYGSVVDAKYKPQIDSVLDVNQLLSYMYRLRSRTGVFILPVSQDTELKQFGLKGYGDDGAASLQIYSFKVNAEADSYDEFKKSMCQSEILLQKYVSSLIIDSSFSSNG
ncbi:hypothetical protein QUW02_01650 [Bacteroides eggerthii]|uniref:McrBC 5-methylcytosine restriction system component n=1 Tax=Bacteroides eggerthii TaxID=28111 RepID=A0ABT7U295_9BACE|nr:hypothetical protein [Bacteroides eggerthii]